MNATFQSDTPTTAIQLRPVVITVVALKLAVFALLMTTVNVTAPIAGPVELADLR